MAGEEDAGAVVEEEVGAAEVEVEEEVSSNSQLLVHSPLSLFAVLLSFEMSGKNLSS